MPSYLAKLSFSIAIRRNQYVPIFRPSDIALTPDQAADLLHRSVFLSQPIDLASQPAHLKVALQQFQMRL
ncbi:MAG TPA: hypothetical protein V6C84_06755 [Coleofasciculaceae cyanobacterium]